MKRRHRLDPRPSRIRSATTAQGSRSARNFGRTRPFVASPTWWPARPMRCRPAATDLATRPADEVDGAHVDAELERRRRHEARQLARLQRLLDDQPLLAGQRAVVRAGERLLGQLVQPQRQPLGRAAVVDEDQRRAVLADELEQLRVDRRPDRLAGRLAALERVELEIHVLRLDHRLHRHVDLQVQRLAHARVHHRRAPLAGRP